MKKVLTVSLLALSVSNAAAAAPSFDFDSFMKNEFRDAAESVFDTASKAYENGKDAIKEEIQRRNNLTKSQNSEPNVNHNGPESFEQAKRWLKDVQRKHHPYTIYTDCPIKFHGKGYSRVSILTDQCNFETYKNAHRASRGEAEHIVPASFYGWTLSCWEDGGRKNCQDVSPAFNKMEADPINLQYAIGSVNADRSNYKFSDFSARNSSKVHDYTGKGDVLFDDVNNLFEPPEYKKGWIGRVTMYMVETYGIPLDRDYLERMESWAQMPATKWECEYNNIVQKDWGYSNHLTTAMCN